MRSPLACRVLVAAGAAGEISGEPCEEGLGGTGG